MSKPAMLTMPASVDRCTWMLDDPSGYFKFARHLAEQFAHYETNGNRKPMHREGSKYWKDSR